MQYPDGILVSEGASPPQLVPVKTLLDHSNGVRSGHMVSATHRSHKGDGTTFGFTRPCSKVDGKLLRVLAFNNILRIGLRREVYNVSWGNGLSPEEISNSSGTTAGDLEFLITLFILPVVSGLGLCNG